MKKIEQVKQTHRQNFVQFGRSIAERPFYKGFSLDIKRKLKVHRSLDICIRGFDADFKFNFCVSVLISNSEHFLFTKEVVIQSYYLIVLIKVLAKFIKNALVSFSIKLLPRRKKVYKNKYHINLHAKRNKWESLGCGYKVFNYNSKSNHSTVSHDLSNSIS